MSVSVCACVCECECVCVCVSVAVFSLHINISWPSTWTLDSALSSRTASPVSEEKVRQGERDGRESRRSIPV